MTDGKDNRERFAAAARAAGCDETAFESAFAKVVPPKRKAAAEKKKAER